MLTELQRQLSEATIFIRDQMPLQPHLAFTLGSGLSAFAEKITRAVKIPFSSIPHFYAPTVEGHGGHLVAGYIGEVPVLALQGRIHYYEGHSPDSVVFPTRVLAQLGIKSLVLTNAAGGLSAKMAPGDFLIIKDHINLTGMNPLRGPNPDFLGPRFPDMSEPYDKKMSEHLATSLKKAGARYSEGVYCGVSGPSYETAAEVRYLQHIGGHAVGMSTVAETIAARHAGLRVAGLSCITNLATGLSTGKVTHDEVKEIAKRVESQFAQALIHFTGLHTS